MAEDRQKEIDDLMLQLEKARSHLDEELKLHQKVQGERSLLEKEYAKAKESRAKIRS